MTSSIDFKPYYAVIFTSIMKNHDDEYGQMAIQMTQLAKTQPGYLGFETSRNEIGISISYWETMDAIHNWKQHATHLLAQQLGQEKWYQYYKVRICKVEREYEFG
ncbi:MAG TPA: antibiotic biosynthesis monooxygenase [Chitinophagaceae bacterium]|jgi:heme-degrading monooxygenase HmoA|nr:antibiotic biosynthesis monooxygenase [Chitinophagaceae bacterium]